MKRAVALCVIAGGLAAADGTQKLDGTYHAKTSTGDWPCPTAHADFTIASGRFSIPWDVDASLSIGTIDGTVDADGSTSVTTQLASPLPRAFSTQAKKARVSIADLRKLQFAVKVRGDTVTLSGGSCKATWARASTDLDCTQKPYAVPEWSEEKPYGGGAYTKIADRIYKCAEACGVGVSPLREEGTWTFVGRCSGTASEPANPYDAKLPDRGDAKWDGTYQWSGVDRADWRCTATKDKVVVAKGKLAIPWSIGDADDLRVGEIDVVTNADGSTQVAPTLAIDALPSEMAQHLRNEGNEGVSRSNLAAFAPTVTFFDDKDMRKNEHGVGRRFQLEANGCHVSYLAQGYKPQRFLEEDGWRIPCASTLAYDAQRAWNKDDTATVTNGSVERMYRCDRDRCTDRPPTAQWVKVGRCKDQ